MNLFYRYPTLRTIVVNLKTDRTFRGVLWKRTGEYLILRNAELVKPGGETVQMDGDLVVLAANIDFLQVV